MGNSRTSRYADGRTLYDLQGATATWLRSLAEATRFELVGPRGVTARASASPRLAPLRRALRRAPAPVPVSTRRGAGEVQRLLVDPDTAPHVRRLARRRNQDEGDVASLWARVRVRPAQALASDLSEVGGS